LPIEQRRVKAANVLLLAFSLLATSPAFAETKHKATSSKHSSRNRSSHVSKTASRSRGQHAIDQERTREIQAALVREHYLNGEPSGVWDQSSKEAMTRYQAANGWQTRITPDSRALIKLGLGPDHKGLLNPETASIPSPHELGVDNATQPGGAADSE
jgi:hypothetical protein